MKRLALLVFAAAVSGASAQSPATGRIRPQTVPRFAAEPNPIALAGPARPSRYMEASGRRAAFIGREDGSFEAWAYPLKILHDFQLGFGVAAYADPIPASALASTVEIRPEASTVRYAHAAFTVDATWLVPLDEPGGVVLLDIDTSEPLTIVVRFRVDLKPMWPAALGGQYSYWDDGVSAFVAGEGSRKHAALVGSPFALKPPEQPAHNLPDAPSQFSIRVTPDVARSGLVPIVIAASAEGLDATKQVYARLLGFVPEAYHASAAHYRRLREHFTSLDTPDDRLDLAFEWGKVALDKGFVCNPQLGCGLIAGLGPSGTTERPGFGWFFGGDAFINAWAITSYGDFDTVRRSLEFLRTRQRADGKMMHELSQGAAYIRWFEDYPYGYYHADTTPLYITAVRDIVRITGDTSLARDFWPSVKKAYEYCLSTDEDGDGLMDNTRAGLAAVETGTLRNRDVLTDVFLAAAWTEAAGAAAELAAMAGDPIGSDAHAAAGKARASLNRRFLDEQGRRIHFAVMRDGRGQSELTVWPAFGLWRGVFDANSPAVGGMLDLLAGSGIGVDWGARMLSRASPLYEPQSYNNGAVWPFLSGFAALALYTHGRADAAWAYLDGTADLTFIEARGYVMELLSGDRLRSVDAAVPHQLFATTGFVSALVRGLVGLDTAIDDRGETRLRLAPQLPVGWTFLRLKNVRWRDAWLDVDLSREARTFSVRLTPRGGAVPVDLRLRLRLGSVVAASVGAGTQVVDESADGRSVTLRIPRVVTAPTTLRLPYGPGIEMSPIHAPLRSGDVSQRLRIIRTSYEAGVYTADVEGRSGRTYRVRLTMPFEVRSLEGATEVRRDGSLRELEVSLPPGPGEWAAGRIVVRTGSAGP
jgi:glycogen debranching enzyme